jgi:hypothetical protein
VSGKFKLQTQRRHVWLCETSSPRLKAIAESELSDFCRFGFAS